MNIIIEPSATGIFRVSLTKKYKTIKGEDVRILSIDRIGFVPVVGLIKRNEDTEELMCWNIVGEPVVAGLYPTDALIEIKEVSITFQKDELIMFKWSKYKPFKPGFYCYFKRECKDSDTGKHVVYGNGTSSWTDNYKVYPYEVRKPTEEEINKFLPANSLLRKLI